MATAGAGGARVRGGARGAVRRWPPPSEIDVLGTHGGRTGNVPLALTQRNARIVCELAGRHRHPRSFSPAATGRWPTASSPPSMSMARPASTASALPEPTMHLAGHHAVEFIIETLRQEPAEVFTPYYPPVSHRHPLCPLAPLTNIALRPSENTNRPRHHPPSFAVQEIVLSGAGRLFSRWATSRPPPNSNI